MSKVYNVNHLPALTWNRLGLNETAFTLREQTLPDTDGDKENVIRGEQDLPGSDISITTGLDSADLEKLYRKWGVTSPKEHVVGGKVPIYREQTLATGMGKDADNFLSDSSVTTDLYEIAPGAKINTPVLLERVYSKGKSSVDSRLIHAGAGSSVTVVMYYHMDVTPPCDSATCPKTDCTRRRGPVEINGALAGSSVKIVAEEGAQVDLIKVQMLDPSYTYLDDTGAFSKNDAKIHVTKLHLGAGRVYDGLNENQYGDRTEFSADMGYVGLPGSEMDINYNDVFIGKKGDGRMNFKEALLGDARKTFRGTIDFRRGSEKSHGDEQEDVLLLGDDVVNKTIPLILGEEEDVDGRHAATIGRLSDDMLFYMESRGISERKAEEIMIRASLNSVSRRIPLDAIRKEAEGYILRIFA